MDKVVRRAVRHRSQFAALLTAAAIDALTLSCSRRFACTSNDPASVTTPDSIDFHLKSKS